MAGADFEQALMAAQKVGYPEFVGMAQFGLARAAQNKVTRGSGADISRDAWIAYLSNRASFIIERGDDPAHPSNEADRLIASPIACFKSIWPQ